MSIDQLKKSKLSLFFFAFVVCVCAVFIGMCKCWKISNNKHLRFKPHWSIANNIDNWVYTSSDTLWELEQKKKLQKKKKRNKSNNKREKKTAKKYGKKKNLLADV